jgi:hypothetical protein
MAAHGQSVGDPLRLRSGLAAPVQDLDLVLLHRAAQMDFAKAAHFGRKAFEDLVQTACAKRG